MKNKYLATHGSSLKALEESISQEKDLADALKGSSGDTSGEVARPTETTQRTLASPDYDGCQVQTFTQTLEFESKPMEEFTAGRQLFGQ